MLQCVVNGVEKVGIPLPEALRMASLYPALLLKDNKLGNIHSGSRADFVVLNDQLVLQQVIVDGE
jgi:N-acetylglucosamine-6-phosphate deacetylase